MKNVRTLLAAAVLAAVAACSGDATAPETAQGPARSSLETVAPDTIIAHPVPGPVTGGAGDGDAGIQSGLVGPGAG